MKFVINSDASLIEGLAAIRAEYREHHFVRITATHGKARSLDHNALSWLWYGQISKELAEQTIEEVHEECKLRLGVPILRAEEPDFRAMYDAGLKHLSYEQKLAAMRWIPVTSLMTRSQMKTYCDSMQADYAKRGVILEYPKEDQPARKPQRQQFKAAA